MIIKYIWKLLKYIHIYVHIELATYEQSETEIIGEKLFPLPMTSKMSSFNKTRTDSPN